MAEKKVNLAKVFQENEQSQKPELEVVESPPTDRKKVAPLARTKNTSVAISMKPSTDR